MRTFLQLLDIPLFNLAHQIAAPEEIRKQMTAQLAWYDYELIVGRLAEGNGPPRGNEMRTPLVDQAEIP
jgi:hypothetical protein